MVTRRDVATVVERHVRGGVAPGTAWLLDDGDRTTAGAAGTWDLNGTMPATQDAVLRIASLTKSVLAVLALALVEDGALDLEEPVDGWLPELSDRRVLQRQDGPLDEVVPAARPVTALDLLTLQMGFGFDVVSQGPTPLWSAVAGLELGLGPPKPGSPLDQDEWLRRSRRFRSWLTQASSGCTTRASPFSGSCSRVSAASHWRCCCVSGCGPARHVGHRL